jgi:lipocalin
MATGADYNVAVVLVNEHEPHSEVATRLIEVAEEKGYDPRVVEAVRGENDAALSFRVPEDVAEAFNADRADRWSAKIENDGEKADDQPVPTVDGDAYAADEQRRVNAVRAANTEDKTTPARTTRANKAKE